MQLVAGGTSSVLRGWELANHACVMRGTNFKWVNFVRCELYLKDAQKRKFSGRWNVTRTSREVGLCEGVSKSGKLSNYLRK